MNKYARILENEKSVIRFDRENRIFFYLLEVRTLRTLSYFLIFSIESGTEKIFHNQVSKQSRLNIIFYISKKSGIENISEKTFVTYVVFKIIYYKPGMCTPKLL